MLKKDNLHLNTFIIKNTLKQYKEVSFTHQTVVLFIHNPLYATKLYLTIDGSPLTKPFQPRISNAWPPVSTQGWPRRTFGFLTLFL